MTDGSYTQTSGWQYYHGVDYRSNSAPAGAASGAAVSKPGADPHREDWRSWTNCECKKEVRLLFEMISHP